MQKTTDESRIIMKMSSLTDRAITIFAKDGYKLLSEDVIDRSSNVNLECPNGHTYSVSLSNFQGNRRCSKCKKYQVGLANFEDFKILLSSEKYTIIEECKPITKRYKCRVICNKGHNWDVSYTDFKLGIRCSLCANNRRLTQEVVANRYLKYGYTLKSKYENSKVKILAICSQGHDWYHYHSNFQKGERCYECHGKKKYSLEEAKTIFISKGFIPTFNTYSSNKELLTYICEKHSYVGEQKCSIHNLIRGSANCQVCYRDKFRGKNNSNWNGGTSDLSKVVRGYLYDNWVLPSLKKDNFRCVITGSNVDLEVHHHIQSFHCILEKSLDTLGIKRGAKLSDISIEQISILKEMVLKLHLDIGLGVTLNKKVHNLFHSLYGSKNNNINQFIEFKNRFSNGEFKKL